MRLAVAAAVVAKICGGDPMFPNVLPRRNFIYEAHVTKKNVRKLNCRRSEKELVGQEFCAYANTGRHDWSGKKLENPGCFHLS